MKISELINVLLEIKSQSGDIDVLGIGHPGEIGCIPKVDVKNKIQFNKGRILQKEEIAVFLDF